MRNFEALKAALPRDERMEGAKNPFLVNRVIVGARLEGSALFWRAVNVDVIDRLNLSIGIDSRISNPTKYERAPGAALALAFSTP
jgi:hypothetical protein